jgi:hypothetical protein
VAKERGFVADFGPHLGMVGWQDWNIARFAFERDYVVVTNNRRHFLREYARYDIHNGLVIVVPQVDRDKQIALFSSVLDHLIGLNSLPANQLVEILDDGSIHVRDWSSDDHDIDHVGDPKWTRE